MLRSTASRTTAFATVTLVLALLATPATADSYLKLLAGLGDLDDGGGLLVDDGDFAFGLADAEYGTGFAGGFALGTDVGEWTVELDYLYRSNDFDRVTFTDGRTVEDGNYASVTIGANAYYRFRTDSNVQPYVGAGFGWVQEVDVDFEENGVETSFETDDSGLQLMAGLRWNRGERWMIDAQVRWLDVSGVTMEGEDGLGTVTADYAPLTALIAVGWRW